MAAFSSVEETTPALAKRLGRKRRQVKGHSGRSAAARPRRGLNGIGEVPPSMANPSGDSEARVYHAG